MDISRSVSTAAPFSAAGFAFGLAIASLSLSACNSDGSYSGQAGGSSIGDGGDGGAGGAATAGPELRVISPGVYRVVFPDGSLGGPASTGGSDAGGGSSGGAGGASGAATIFSAPQCTLGVSFATAPALLAPRTAPTTPLPLPGREIGGGRHPMAAGCNALGVTFIDRATNPAALDLALFSPSGARGGVLPFGSLHTEQPAPSIAALPGETFAVAWSDFDDDELGIQLRKLDPNATTQAAAVFANVGSAFSQSAPDVVFDGKDLIVAWVDSSDAANGPDIRYRTFDSNLSPTSGDLTLAATDAAETDVALAALNGSWAAAWRSGNAGDGTQTIEAQSGTAHWSVGPFLPGGSEDRPALIFLDATHLALAFTEGTDPTGSGTANVPRLFAAVLDAAHPGTALPFPVAPRVAPYSTDGTLAQRQPALERVGDGLVVAWRADAIPGDARGEQLWQRHVTWSTSDNSVVIDASASDQQVITVAAAAMGDQRAPALLSPPFLPIGNLVSAWEDLGKTFGAPAGNPDVAFQFSRVPVDQSTLWVADWKWSNKLYGFNEAQVAAPGLSAAGPSRVVTTPTSPTSNAPVAMTFTSAGDLWVAFCTATAEPQLLKKFSAGSLAVSGAPTPDLEFTLPTPDTANYTCPVSLAFDASGALWVSFIAWSGHVLEFEPERLLASGPLLADVNLGSPDFVSINDSIFDSAGNLYVSGYSSGIVSRISPSQLLTSDPALVPAARIAIPGPTGMVWDAQGNLWVADYDHSRVMQIDPSDLVVSGTPTPKVVFTGVAGPEDLSFDRAGNLWVSSWDADYVADFAPEDLTSSGAKTPLTTLAGNGSFAIPIDMRFSPGTR